MSDEDGMHKHLTDFSKGPWCSNCERPWSRGHECDDGLHPGQIVPVNGPWGPDVAAVGYIDTRAADGHAACRDDRRRTRDLAGHRVRDIDHDCFVMHCRDLGYEVLRLNEALANCAGELDGSGLDVERLARALYNTHALAERDSSSLPMGNAANIAREYAALSAVGERLDRPGNRANLDAEPTP